MAWNSARLKGALTGDAANYDAREVRAAANALAAVANSGLAALFVAGTEQGKGWRETTARPAVFTDAQTFRKLNDEFAADAAALARIAAGIFTPLFAAGHVMLLFPDLMKMEER